MASAISNYRVRHSKDELAAIVRTIGKKQASSSSRPERRRQNARQEKINIGVAVMKARGAAGAKQRSDRWLHVRCASRHNDDQDDDDLPTCFYSSRNVFVSYRPRTELYLRRCADVYQTSGEGSTWAPQNNEYVDVEQYKSLRRYHFKYKLECVAQPSV